MQSTFATAAPALDTSGYSTLPSHLVGSTPMASSDADIDMSSAIESAQATFGVGCCAVIEPALSDDLLLGSVERSVFCRFDLGSAMSPRLMLTDCLAIVRSRRIIVYECDGSRCLQSGLKLITYSGSIYGNIHDLITLPLSKARVCKRKQRRRMRTTTKTNTSDDGQSSLSFLGSDVYNGDALALGVSVDSSIMRTVMIVAFQKSTQQLQCVMNLDVSLDCLRNGVSLFMDSNGIRKNGRLKASNLSLIAKPCAQTLKIGATLTRSDHLKDAHRLLPPLWLRFEDFIDRNSNRDISKDSDPHSVSADALSDGSSEHHSTLGLSRRIPTDFACLLEDKLSPSLRNMKFIIESNDQFKMNYSGMTLTVTCNDQFLVVYEMSVDRLINLISLKCSRFRKNAQNPFIWKDIRRDPSASAQKLRSSLESKALISRNPKFAGWHKIHHMNADNAGLNDEIERGGMDVKPGHFTMMSEKSDELEIRSVCSLQRIVDLSAPDTNLLSISMIREYLQFKRKHREEQANRENEMRDGQDDGGDLNGGKGNQMVSSVDKSQSDESTASSMGQDAEDAFAHEHSVFVENVSVMDWVALPSRVHSSLPTLFEHNTHHNHHSRSDHRRKNVRSSMDNGTILVALVSEGDTCAGREAVKRDTMTLHTLLVSDTAVMSDVHQLFETDIKSGKHSADSISNECRRLRRWMMTNGILWSKRKVLSYQFSRVVAMSDGMCAVLSPHCTVVFNVDNGTFLASLTLNEVGDAIADRILKWTPPKDANAPGSTISADHSSHPGSSHRSRSSAMMNHGSSNKRGMKANYRGGSSSTTSQSGSQMKGRMMGEDDGLEGKPEVKVVGNSSLAGITPTPMTVNQVTGKIMAFDSGALDSCVSIDDSWLFGFGALLNHSSDPRGGGSHSTQSVTGGIGGTTHSSSSTSSLRKATSQRNSPNALWVCFEGSLFCISFLVDRTVNTLRLTRVASGVPISQHISSRFCGYHRSQPLMMKKQSSSHDECTEHIIIQLFASSKVSEAGLLTLDVSGVGMPDLKMLWGRVARSAISFKTRGHLMIGGSGSSLSELFGAGAHPPLSSLDNSMHSPSKRKRNRSAMISTDEDITESESNDEIMAPSERPRPSKEQKMAELSASLFGEDALKAGPSSLSIPVTQIDPQSMTTDFSSPRKPSASVFGTETSISPSPDRFSASLMAIQRDSDLFNHNDGSIENVKCLSSLRKDGNVKMVSPWREGLPSGVFQTRLLSAHLFESGAPLTSLNVVYLEKYITEDDGDFDVDPLDPFCNVTCAVTTFGRDLRSTLRVWKPAIRPSSIKSVSVSPVHLTSLVSDIRMLHCIPLMNMSDDRTLYLHSGLSGSSVCSLNRKTEIKKDGESTSMMELVDLCSESGNEIKNNISKEASKQDDCDDDSPSDSSCFWNPFLKDCETLAMWNPPFSQHHWIQITRKGYLSVTLDDSDDPINEKTFVKGSDRFESWESSSLLLSNHQVFMAELSSDQRVMILVDCLGSVFEMRFSKETQSASFTIIHQCLFERTRLNDSLRVINVSVIARCIAEERTGSSPMKGAHSSLSLSNESLISYDLCAVTTDGRIWIYSSMKKQTPSLLMLNDDEGGGVGPSLSSDEEWKLVFTSNESVLNRVRHLNNCLSQCQSWMECDKVYSAMSIARDEVSSPLKLRADMTFDISDVCLCDFGPHYGIIVCLWCMNAKVSRKGNSEAILMLYRIDGLRNVRTDSLSVGMVRSMLSNVSMIQLSDQFMSPHPFRVVSSLDRLLSENKSEYRFCPRFLRVRFDWFNSRRLSDDQHACSVLVCGHCPAVIRKMDFSRVLVSYLSLPKGGLFCPSVGIPHNKDEKSSLTLAYWNHTRTHFRIARFDQDESLLRQKNPFSDCRIGRSVVKTALDSKHGAIAMAVSLKTETLALEMPTDRSLRHFKTMQEAWLFDVRRLQMSDRVCGLQMSSDEAENSYEAILALDWLSLRQMSRASMVPRMAPKVDFIVAGTGTNNGEDQSSAGRLLMFEVLPQLEKRPHSETELDMLDSEGLSQCSSKGRIRLRMSTVFATEERAPITAVCSVKGSGLLVAAVGPKLLVYRWTGIELVGCSFIETGSFCDKILGMHNYIVVSDALCSPLSVYHWESQIAELVRLFANEDEREPNGEPNTSSSWRNTENESAKDRCTLGCACDLLVVPLFSASLDASVDGPRECGLHACISDHSGTVEVIPICSAPSVTLMRGFRFRMDARMMDSQLCQSGNPGSHSGLAVIQDHCLQAPGSDDCLEQSHGSGKITGIRIEISKYTMSRLNDGYHLMMALQNGHVNRVCPLDENHFRILFELQTLLIYLVPHFGGLNPRRYRYSGLNWKAHANKRTLLDGALLACFFELDYPCQYFAAISAGSTVCKLRSLLLNAFFSRRFF